MRGCLILMFAAFCNAVCFAYSLQDFSGPFACEFVWSVSTDHPGNLRADVKQVSGNTLELVFDQFNHAVLTGIADPTAGTLTFNSWQNTDIYNSGADNLYLCIYDKTDSGNIPRDSAIGRIQPDGSICFGENVIIAYRWKVRGNYNFAVRDLRLIPPPYFRYNSSDWQPCGEALVEENCMNMMLHESERVAPYHAPLEQSVNNPDLYLLKNPYSAWHGLNQRPGADGYLLFSIANTGCVTLRPFTPSGLWYSRNGNAIDTSPTQAYIYNLEGREVHVNGLSVDEAGAKLHEAGYDTSVFDPFARVVTLRNLRWGISEAPDAAYMLDTDSPLTITITFPAKNGIDGIDAESDAASSSPTMYYNLQGQRIAAPLPGQPCIERRAGQARKLIHN